MTFLEKQSTSLSYNDRLINIRQGELTQLRREAAYYKSQFEIKKRKTLRILDFCRELKGEKKKIWHLLFGKKSETKKNNESSSKTGTRKRGKQKGDSGSGRKREDKLTTNVEVIDLPEDKKKCSGCGLEFEDLNCTSDSEVIEVEVAAHRRIIKRKIYKKICKCKKTPALIRAPSTPKLIPKGKFGVSFWVYVLLQKYCYHTPVNRILNQLSNHGLEVSGGTIVGGMKYIKKMLEPMYAVIEKKNQSEHHWHADETRWMVFASHRDKKGHRWYVWIFQSETTVYYKIMPTRGAKVVKEHFKESYGIISADRYGAYKTLLKTGLFLIAYCWAHVRRDFLNLAKGYKEFADWAELWVQRINFLYHINNQRIKASADSKEYAKIQEELQSEILKIRSQLEEELVEFQFEFPSARRKVLESLKNHWHGLTLFVPYSWVPMDNNPAERAGRDPVVGRKNYYGSGSVESSQVAQMSFSIIATIEIWGLNIHSWLSSYLQACAENQGKPPKNLRPFLPWEMTAEELKKYGGKQESLPQTYSEITKEQIRCAIVDETFPKKKLKSLKPLSKKRQSQNSAHQFQGKFAEDLTGKNTMEVSKTWRPESHFSRWKRTDFSFSHQAEEPPNPTNKDSPI